MYLIPGLVPFALENNSCMSRKFLWVIFLPKKTQDQSSSYWNYLTTSTIMRNILKADSSEACLIYARPKDHHSHAQSAKKTGFRHLGRHGTQQSLAAAVHCCALWIRCSKRFERKELNWCVYVVIYIYITSLQRISLYIYMYLYVYVLYQ